MDQYEPTPYVWQIKEAILPEQQFSRRESRNGLFSCKIQNLRFDDKNGDCMSKPKLVDFHSGDIKAIRRLEERWGRLNTQEQRLEQLRPYYANFCNPDTEGELSSPEIARVPEWMRALHQRSECSTEDILNLALNTRQKRDGFCKTNTNEICSIPINIALSLGLLAICTPCAALLLDSPNNIRNLAGVISGSSGLSLTSLPRQDSYNALRWVVRILWAITYLTFLRSSYKSLHNNSNRPIFVFLSLLLTVHFVIGLSGAADSTDETWKGVLTFGPLVATICAALVYIPFHWRNAMAQTASGTLRDEEAAAGQAQTIGRGDAGEGDLGLGQAVLHSAMGPVFS